MTDKELSPARPVPPIDYIPQLAAPLLGLLGNDDSHPTPQEVDLLEARSSTAGRPGAWRWWSAGAAGRR